MLHSAAFLQRARQFAHDRMAHHIRGDVGIGIDERIADASLRRQMNDPVDLIISEQDLGRFGIGNVELAELEFRLVGQCRQPRLFEPDIVIVGHVVDADDILAPRQQLLTSLMADKSCRAGHQNSHPGSLPTSLIFQQPRGVSYRRQI